MLNTSMMRIVLLTETFSRKMGYLETLLPKYLARLGAQVHVISMDLPPYYWLKDFGETYGHFCEELQAGSVEACDGYTLHVLAHKKVAGYMRMDGLRRKLRLIRPDVVQTMSVIGWIPLDAASYQPLLGYKLFTGCHTTASVFPLATRRLPWWNKSRLQCSLARAIPGRLVSCFSEKCYAVTEDCAHIASSFFGVPPHKVDLMYLGVDTEYNYPVATDAAAKERLLLRRKLGFNEEDIVCICTGKFTGEKKLFLLAESVEQLKARGEPFRALFIGNGPERRMLQKYSSSTIVDFMPFSEVGQYYRAADIGVWPGNESTSMLDAAACGLPVVVSDQVVYRAPVNGNGLTFKSDSVEALMDVLMKLREPQTRQSFGSSGALRMAREFSWQAVAMRRLGDYKTALGSNGSLNPEIREDRLSRPIGSR
jgi:glycosyltransferase involved in cell wall biosynthesis